MDLIVQSNSNPLLFYSLFSKPTNTLSLTDSTIFIFVLYKFKSKPKFLIRIKKYILKTSVWPFTRVNNPSIRQYNLLRVKINTESNILLNANQDDRYCFIYARPTSHQQNIYSESTNFSHNKNHEGIDYL